jgi:glycosyltransferase involved in cell wall biosynthesis
VKVHVLHVISGLGVGGAENMLHKLLSTMDRSVEASVVSLKSGGAIAQRIKELGIPVHSLDLARPVASMHAVLRTWKIIREIQTDIVQGWMYHGNLVAQLAGALIAAPVVWNVRGAHHILREERATTAATIWLGGRLSWAPRRIIYNSEVAAQMHEKHLGYRREKRELIPNGFDTNLFAPNDEYRLNVRADLGIPPDAVAVGLVARYHSAKDPSNFVKAAAIVGKMEPHTHFIMVGSGFDESNRALLKLIDDVQLKHIHLLGERADIPRLTASFDIATCASNIEGFPNSIGEALSCGVPCVATDVGDCRWIVGESGCLAPPRNESALAEGILKLARLSRDERRQLGIIGRNRIRELFALSDVATRYRRIYESVLSETN